MTEIVSAVSPSAGASVFSWSMLGRGFRLGLPDHLKFFQGHFVFQEMRWTTFMGVCRGAKMGFAPTLEIGTKNQKKLENLKLASQFR